MKMKSQNKNQNPNSGVNGKYLTLLKYLIILFIILLIISIQHLYNYKNNKCIQNPYTYSIIKIKEDYGVNGLGYIYFYSPTVEKHNYDRFIFFNDKEVRFIKLYESDSQKLEDELNMLGEISNGHEIQVIN